MKYRYEIKIPISKFNETIYLNWILSLKKLRIQNESREINNIYYDTLNFESAKNNLDGISNRTKYRVRWYKKNLQYSNCNVELKIKREKLIKKIIIPTNLNYSDVINKDFFDLVKNSLNNKNINDRNLYIQKFFQTVQNKYHRVYYSYNDIRLTYDTKIYYKNLRMRSINEWYNDNLNVLEIKFNEEKLNQARQLISRIPLVPMRHSKYLRGLSHSKMAVYIWFKIVIFLI